MAIVRIQIRRDTNDRWNDINPILAEGEIGYITDKSVYKIGDGVSNFGSLPAWSRAITWGNIEGALAEQTDLSEAISESEKKAEWGELSGTLNDQIDLKNIMDLKLEYTIETTQDNLINNLIPNSLLKSGQKYLITDYVSYGAVVGSSNSAFYTGNVEPIFVYAATANTLQRKGYSALHPDEEIEFDASIIRYTANKNAYVDGGAGAGDFNFTMTGANSFSIDTEELDDFEDITSISMYIEDYDSGAYSEITSIYEKDKTFTYNTITNEISILDYSSHYAEYEEGSNVGDETITVINSNSFSITNLLDEPRTASNYDSAIDVNDYTNGTYYSYEWEEYGTTWEISSSGVITLLNTVEANIDLTNAGYMYWSWKKCPLTPLADLDLVSNGSYIDLNFDYYLPTETKGRIVARRNLKKTFYMQADYRAGEGRRHKPSSVSEYVYGPKTKGHQCHTAGYVWRCIADTSATPSTASRDWIQLWAYDYVMNTGFYINGTPLGMDNDDYADLPLIDIASFDASSQSININIYNNNPNPESELNFVCTGDITNSNNSDIYVGANGFTLTSFVRNSVVKANGVIAEVINACPSINDASTAYIGYVSNVSFGYLSACFIKYLINSSGLYMNNNIFAKNSSSTTNTFVYLTNALFCSTTSRNDIVYSDGTLTARNDFLENYIKKASRTINLNSAFRYNFFNIIDILTTNNICDNFLSLGGFYNNTLGYCTSNMSLGDFSSNNIPFAMNRNLMLVKFSGNNLSNSVSNSAMNDNLLGYCNGLTANSGAKFNFANNTYLGKVQKLRFSGGNTTTITNNFGKDFGSSSYWTDFDNTSGNINFRYNTQLGNIYRGMIKRTDFDRNIFLNDLSDINIGSDSYLAVFSDNTVLGATDELTISSTSISSIKFTTFNHGNSGYTMNGTCWYNIFPAGLTSLNLNNISYMNMLQGVHLRDGLVANTASTPEDFVTVIKSSAVSANTTVRLPEAKVAGRILYIVVEEITGGYTITVEPYVSGQTVNGSTSAISLTTQYEVIELLATGTKEYIIKNRYIP